MPEYFKLKSLPNRYDLKFNVRCDRTLYTNKEYHAFIEFDKEGCNLVDFDTSLVSLYMRENTEENILLMEINCWDILYILENKDICPDELFEQLNLIDLKTNIDSDTED